MVLGNFLTFLKRVVSDPADQAELTLWISWDQKKSAAAAVSLKQRTKNFQYSMNIDDIVI